ncbi:hypothetical protein HHK36_002299 [Tetracentron sinense]|uniref:HMA domain-containing protein n=1 Tax=Tetracentron sinense TaxID=13715 RepID=A0A834ZXY7_TETSI|nr:hypothetical protein HHK36_002299 [Tetracentron sinense]
MIKIKEVETTLCKSDEHPHDSNMVQNSLKDITFTQDKGDKPVSPYQNQKHARSGRQNSVHSLFDNMFVSPVNVPQVVKSSSVGSHMGIHEAQKVVMKVSMNDQKSRSKAMKIAVGVPGVESAAIQGDDKSQIVVTGDGIDSTDLTMLLRKKFGRADLQKVVMKISMHDQKARSKALKIVVGVPGVESATLQGDDKTQIVVTGEGIDSTDLTMLLRKKFKIAQLESVALIKEEDKKKETQAAIYWPNYQLGVPHYYEVPATNHYDSCTIM